MNQPNYPNQQQHQNYPNQQPNPNVRNPQQYPNYPYRPQKKKPESTTIALWVCAGLLGLVLIAGLLFVGIYLYQNHFSPIRASVEETVASPTPLPSPVPSAQPTVSPTAAPANGVVFVNAFSDSGIYVRTGPGTNYTQLLYIPAANTDIKLTYLDSVGGADGYTWYHVNTYNGQGYVRSDVVRLPDAPMQKSIKEPSASSGPQPVYYVNALSNSDIFIRTGPGTNYGKLMLIKAGDTTVLLAYSDAVTGTDGYIWYHVSTPAGMGYVRSDLVRVK